MDAFTRTLVLVSIAVTATSCKKKEEAAAASNTPPVVKPEPAPAPPPAKRRPWIDEAGRGGAKCEFVKFGGEGKDRSAMFKITMPPGREPDFYQTWQFYYDKSGKQISRYPHATSPESTEVRALGSTGDSIRKETAKVECEITRIRFKDKTSWFNANLVPCCSDRPQGGITDADLKARSGEKVAVTVLDPKTRHVRLKNLTEKEVKRVDVDLLYMKPDGTPVGAQQSLDVAIKPGETIEKRDFDLSGSDEAIAQIKAQDAAHVEGFVHGVQFADDSRWENHNLEVSEIPSP